MGFFFLLFMNRTCGVRKKKDLVGGGLLSLETKTCRPDKQEISSSRLILCKKKNVSTPPHVFCAGGDSHPFFPDFACQLTSGVQKCFAHSRQSQTVIALQGYVCRKMRNAAPPVNTQRIDYSLCQHVLELDHITLCMYDRFLILA